MGKLAFIFPGQGAQKAGMGRELAERFPEARAVFEAIDGALGEPLSRLCFEGPDEALKLTANTQPAILAVSSAAASVLAARRTIIRSNRGSSERLPVARAVGEAAAVDRAREILGAG